ncbi:hypothetical protein N7448_002425 [Penicillium atrosanguineum]|uniref:Uncharacterized protein n=1 Tax=Penicillium atrosanguineum TaxID=1132637 RepID=A0A9W9HE16_9EURO|nr:CAZyme family CE10 [Penicillium atrosanguineum]KAJ5128707.1 hypothetical protein N7526_006873 [Penicillium atrosanguineum]KAJ5145033.1 hypothetical protein N7448_002425 [Penicillium atrosanguineum]KAJ5300824.1 CAZyme family CE10 [Penicillium atrosanguineum]KAJ5311468.1 hypothetical protein N7476_007328 [Penicillium atrosanguineum]
MTASSDTLTKVSTDAATELVNSFYPALGKNRDAIASFYSTTPTSILLNGNQIESGAAVQKIFIDLMPAAHYEAQSFDCQVINPAYPTITANGVKPPSEMTVKDMSILVIVSGYVRYGEGRDQPHRGFSETFVLVPNPSTERGGRRKGWLIQSQNFRLVV